MTGAGAGGAGPGHDGTCGARDEVESQENYIAGVGAGHDTVMGLLYRGVVLPGTPQ